jgi:hypothetical protein
MFAGVEGGAGLAFGGAGSGGMGGVGAVSSELFNGYGLFHEFGPSALSYSMGKGWGLKSELGQVMGGEGDKVLGVEVNGSGTSTQRDGKPEERMPPGMGAWQPKRPLHGELERDPARSWCVTGGCCANRIAGRWED